MTELKVDDINVLSEETLINPTKLKEDIPATDQALAAVSAGRLAIKRILAREDPRLIIIIGPCSIHDISSVMD